MRVIQVRRPLVARQTGNGGHAAAKLGPSPAMDAVFDLQRSVGNRVTTELIGRTFGAARTFRRFLALPGIGACQCGAVCSSPATKRRRIRSI